MNIAEVVQFEPICNLDIQRPLRIGVLGAARIVPKAMCAALGDVPFLARVVAIAARDRNRAAKMAEKYGIERHYGSYRELIEDPELDAIYVAAPCSEHAALSEASLRAKKHVLCEKPFSLDLAQAKSALNVAAQERRLLMEAHHWRYHALLPEASRLIEKVGVIQQIETSFCGSIDDPNDIRRNARLGAGVTMDFGCYALQWVSWAKTVGPKGGRLDEAQVEINRASMGEEGPGIDVLLDADLSVDGVPAKIHCDMRAGTPYSTSLTVIGDLGRVHFENPLVVEGSSVSFEPSARGASEGLKSIRATPENATTTYREQLIAFHHAVTTGEPPLTSGASVLHTQGLLDQMYRVAGLPSRSDLAEQHNE